MRPGRSLATSRLTTREYPTGAGRNCRRSRGSGTACPCSIRPARHPLVRSGRSRRRALRWMMAQSMTTTSGLLGSSRKRLTMTVWYTGTFTWIAFAGRCTRPFSYDCRMCRITSVSAAWLRPPNLVAASTSASESRGPRSSSSSIGFTPITAPSPPSASFFASPAGSLRALPEEGDAARPSKLALLFMPSTLELEFRFGVWCGWCACVEPRPVEPCLAPTGSAAECICRSSKTRSPGFRQGGEPRRTNVVTTKWRRTALEPAPLETDQ